MSFFSCWRLRRPKKIIHSKPDTSGLTFPIPPRQSSNLPPRKRPYPSNSPLPGQRKCRECACVHIHFRRKHNQKFGNLNKYSISFTVRHSMENTEAKEEQSAFKSPLNCSLQVDAHFFQVDMYRFGDFMGSNSEIIL